MPSAAHRREWEYFANQEPPEDAGAVAPRARFGPTGVDGATEAKPQRARQVLLLLAILGGVGLLLFPSTKELLVRLCGEGYVHWHLVRFQAVQAAVSHDEPLVILSRHPSQSGAKTRLAKEVLTAGEIQRLSGDCIWLVVDGPLGVPPTLTVMFQDDATVLAGPWKVSEVTAPQLERDLKAALEENRRLVAETTKGS